MYKTKDLAEETLIGSFYEKRLLLSTLSKTRESDSHIREKVKVVLDLTNYATKKN